jgi:hypothetical protein
MQPYLHIFPHTTLLAPSPRPNPCHDGAPCESDGRHCERLELQARVQNLRSRRPVHALGAGALGAGDSAGGGDPSRYDPPVPLEPAHQPRRLVAAPRRLPAALILAAASWMIAGCGSSHTTGTKADPASVVPASAPLYAGATIRPGEPLKAAARAAGRTLTHQADPYLNLLGALQTPGSPALNFEKDVAPWLGARGGIFLSSLDASGEARIGQLLSLLAKGRRGGTSAASSAPFGTNGVQGAIVLDTSDVARARSFLASQAKRAGAHASVYRGVSYQATVRGIAFGVVDRFAVIGSEPGIRSIVDTTLGGPSLARGAGYAKLLASAPSGVLAHLYMNGQALAARHEGSRAQGLRGLVELLAGNRLLNTSLVPSTSSLALDADALASSSTAAPAGLLSSGSEGARALGELPGESWLAVGLGDVSHTLGADVQQLRSLASLASSFTGSGSSAQTSAGFSVNGLLDAILAPLSALGANSAAAARDYQSWMGSAGIFASGSGLLELRGAVVVASKNPALSRSAVGKLAADLRKRGGTVQAVSIAGTDASVAVRLAGLPLALSIADGRGANGQSKFVIGLGESSVAAALSPSSTLSGAASHAAAAATLGEGFQPSLIVDFPTLLSLLEGVGLGEDPTVSPLLPYLRSLTTLAGGSKVMGAGIERSRFVLGLQKTG